MTWSTRFLLSVAMSMLSLVSIWTTYASLNDSILPEPKIAIPLAEGTVWQCSIVALGLSVAIGLMLLSLKIAIIGGHKRLNIAGVLGLTVVAFISITFNMDVLYRTADKDFYLRYSNDRMRAPYEAYMAKTQGVLLEKRTELLKGVAKQEGELDAEVKGLRKAPAGYGQYARQEEYNLTILSKETEVELQAVEAGLVTKEKADELLRAARPTSLEDIDKNQAELRVIIKDLAAVTGVPLPELVKTESPLFAVFAKLMDVETVGFKEIFFLLLAFLLDLGDIVGYSLVPNARRDKRRPDLDEDGPGNRITVLPRASDELFASLPVAVPAPSQPGEAPLQAADSDTPPPPVTRRRAGRVRLLRRG
jgi:hypothetical protein